ncbi:hypothetical protein JCM30471_16010 [Desulfuromonas carbonis]|uniref:hypothetical protein n=1 Tax=Desulfuromonas sp. DDH964 TaxID=1823759 RepID=UPI00078D0BBF|nr:hypothetical protein [Desulfuromonas sp. DDH964]AMV73192.1 hypothetical protein DBW_2883 [Desulfuromonas sp. DDH964]
MGLSIDFECPQCKKAVHRDLSDLSPSQRSRCPECATPVELSSLGLRNFQQALQDYCRP